MIDRVKTRTMSNVGRADVAAAQRSDMAGLYPTDTPRFHLHFTPPSSSWLNLVERNLTDKRIRRGTFDSVSELIEAIMDYIDAHNQDPAAEPLHFSLPGWRHP